MCCDVRGSQEVKGSQAAADAKQRKDTFMALRSTAKTIALAAPMLLSNLGRDLLSAVVSGDDAQRYIAMDLASLAHSNVHALLLSAHDRQQVRRPCWQFSHTGTAGKCLNLLECMLPQHPVVAPNCAANHSPLPKHAERLKCSTVGCLRKTFVQGI